MFPLFLINIYLKSVVCLSNFPTTQADIMLLNSWLADFDKQFWRKSCFYYVNQIRLIEKALLLGLCQENSRETKPSCNSL